MIWIAGALALAAIYWCARLKRQNDLLWLEKTCTECRGTGTVSMHISSASSYDDRRYLGEFTCKTCDGNGNHVACWTWDDLKMKTQAGDTELVVRESSKR